MNFFPKNYLFKNVFIKKNLDFIFFHRKYTLFWYDHTIFYIKN